MSLADEPDAGEEAPTPQPQQERPFVMGDAGAEKDRNKAIRQKGARIDEAYRALMQHQDGRLMMWDMLSECGVFQTTHQGESTHASAFNEGQRNVGLKLFLRLMKLCPDQYATMQKENGK